MLLRLNTSRTREYARGRERGERLHQSELNFVLHSCMRCRGRGAWGLSGMQRSLCGMQSPRGKCKSQRSATSARAAAAAAADDDLWSQQNRGKTSGVYLLVCMCVCVCVSLSLSLSVSLYGEASANFLLFNCPPPTAASSHKIVGGSSPLIEEAVL